jgi:uncharacterized membrane protein (UPF0136 family)
MDTVNTTNDDSSSMHPGTIVGGSILLLLGAAMLLDATGTFRMSAGRMFTPLILIVLGSTMMFDRGGLVAGRQSRRLGADGERILVRRGRSGRSGLWLIGVGAWMLISQNHLFGLSYATSWPLFIILSGVMLIIRGIR